MLARQLQHQIDVQRLPGSARPRWWWRRPVGSEFVGDAFSHSAIRVPNLSSSAIFTLPCANDAALADLEESRPRASRRRGLRHADSAARSGDR